jgi:hypothetical protein
MNESVTEFSRRLKRLKQQTDLEWRWHILNGIAQHRQRDVHLQVHEIGPVGGEFVDQMGVPQQDALHAWGRIHGSHRRMIVRNLIFCRRCGYWTSMKITTRLSGECKGDMTHAVKHRLKRMRNGYHPVHSALFWPDGSSTAEPSKVLALDL